VQGLTREDLALSPATNVESKTLKRVGIPIFAPLEAKLKVESDQRRPAIVFVAGPTGCGKTEISLMLAAAAEGEIITADSMQVYRGMDIGTAKATLAQQAKIPHHLMDIREVWQSFNVVDFYHEAQCAIEEITRRGKLPIVVGGAGFYLHALLYGPPAGPPSVDELRQQLEAEMQRLGPEPLYAELVQRDAEYAATITAHDRQKIIRALEIMRLTGFAVSSLSWKDRQPSLQLPFRAWFLFRPREVLYQRVEERCDQMLAEGFLEEVKKLEAAGIRQNRSASNAIGYSQALKYLDSARTEADFEAFVTEFKRASRHYIKRQFTWFRREPLFQWLDVEAHDPEVVIDMMLQQIRAL
jgi:tRNA dimethylallyltransferase